MHYEMITVTPDLAKKWLEQKNKRNRNLSPKKVDAYASDMTFGRWAATHQNAIAFYRDGNLADGQHRLAAIVKSGMSIEFMVWFGLEDSSAYGIDAHRMRTTVDQIKIAGGVDWIDRNIIACARMLMPESKHGHAAASPQMIVEFCELHRDALVFASQNVPSSSAPAPIRVAVASAFYHVPKDVLSDWCDIMRTGMGMGETAKTVLTLRDRVLREKILRAGGNANREYLVRLTMRSIQAYSDGQVLTKLYEPKGRIYEIAA